MAGIQFLPSIVFVDKRWVDLSRGGLGKSQCAESNQGDLGSRQEPNEEGFLRAWGERSVQELNSTEWLRVFCGHFDGGTLGD